MNFVPENEMGVIVRFSQDIVSIDNVFFATIRTEFPDAILIVNGKKVRTEFEYRSSNFIVHKHDPRKCDLIICWIDDVQHKNKLPTWEISKNEWLSLEIPRISISQKEALYWECRARRAERRANKLTFNIVECTQDTPLPRIDLAALKPDILAELEKEKPNLARLATDLGIGRSTLYRHLGTMAGTGEVVKNGNGYEIANS